MIEIAVCLFALVGTFKAGRRSVSSGLIALLCFGYFYGIVRANSPGSAIYFMFDCALLGLYASQPWRPGNAGDRYRTRVIQLWLVVLVAWPVLLSFLPFQPFLVSIVGLRGNIFFLPVLLVGAQLEERELPRLVTGLALLNVAALAFGSAEYVLGIERFYPVNAATAIIYASRDIGNYTWYRIPATFTSAHAYAGTMVMTMPLLLGGWSGTALSRREKLLVAVGLLAAMLGVLMASARTHFVICLILILLSLFRIRMSPTRRGMLLVLVICLAIVTSRNERFQRFRTLGDTEGVSERISGSVNRTFWEILTEYPMGNGLGGGGTSMPSFLALSIRQPVNMENEYARILLEQGVIGLGLWLAFIAWWLTRRAAFCDHPWQSGRVVAFATCILYFGSGLIGTGLLTSIPQTVLLLLSLGWSVVKPETLRTFEAARRPEYSGMLALGPEAGQTRI
jgi:hypothetical protein